MFMIPTNAKESMNQVGDISKTYPKKELNYYKKDRNPRNEKLNSDSKRVM